ncbi:transposase, IS605 OrfB family [Mycobacterium xenopi 4042]|uniref:Transposase, IS605 OrfB family n=1 Tax=Mycobacterium xenopi 4042 TaxID=1299334 RepID=X7ZWM8_MYCXE|nr:transposase, IS605 OrfB family [Mycobacterium xenopi 4042]
MSRPPSWTLGCGTHPLTLQPKTAGWEWAAACQRFWLRPPPTGLGSPASTMRQGAGHGVKQQRRLSNSLSRKKKGSQNRTDAAARLGRHHHRVATVRRHFLHQVSGELVRTHDRIVVENLNMVGMLANHRLARAISDAGWAEFARMLRYKQAWRHGQLVEADRWYPSTRLCPQCGVIDGAMTLVDRVFTCGCGHSADRDTNAATNLARWATPTTITFLEPRTPSRRPATNACRRDGSGQHPHVGETSPDDAGTDVHTAPAA